MDKPYPFLPACAPPMRAALILAHPAHELRVFGWLRRVRPVVEVLTTGSRSGAGAERLARTGELVDAAGAQRGALFGQVLDRDFYALLMRGDHGPLADWIGTMAEDLVQGDVELVVTDGWQGYSAAHDLVHLMARLAANRAQGSLGRPVRVVQYATVSAGLAPLKSCGGEVGVLDLDAEETSAKLAAIEAYPDIAEEAAEIFRLEGRGCLAVERFFEPPPLDVLLMAEAQPPFYERIGEERVRSGHYSEVLRQAHVVAIGKALMAQEVPGRVNLGLSWTRTAPAP